MIKVLIADNYELTREGLKNMLAKYTDDEIKVIGEVIRVNELLDAIAKEKPSIILFNMNIPGKDSLEILKNIRPFYPDIPVLVLSVHLENKFAVRALKAGVAGYFSRSGTSKELAVAIRMIVKGGKKYVSPDVADQIAEYFDGSEQNMPHEKLSDREYQVLCKIASGKKIKNIAADLSLSVQTIHTYRARLKEKMNMKTDTELTKYAIQSNLIDWLILCVGSGVLLVVSCWLFSKTKQQTTTRYLLPSVF